MFTREAHWTPSRINSGEWSLCPMPSSLCLHSSSPFLLSPLFRWHLWVSLTTAAVLLSHSQGRKLDWGRCGCVGSARPGDSPPGPGKLSALEEKGAQQCLPCAEGLTAQDLQTVPYSIRALFLLYFQRLFKSFKMQLCCNIRTFSFVYFSNIKYMHIVQQSSPSALDIFFPFPNWNCEPVWQYVTVTPFYFVSFWIYKRLLHKCMRWVWCYLMFHNWPLSSIASNPKRLKENSVHSGDCVKHRNQRESRKNKGELGKWQSDDSQSTESILLI